MMFEKRRPVYIIAEAGVNHNGDAATALELVKVARECGVDAVKFQTFKAEFNVSCHAELAGYQEAAEVEAANQLEMLRQLELSRDEFKTVKNLCDELRIDFISTPDDDWSIDLLLELDVPAIKIASAEMDNLPFLDKIGRTGKTVILSTGMSTLAEVERAVDTFRNAGTRELALLHCISNYPTAIGDVNLKAMNTLSEAFALPVGFSDHTLGSEAAVAAVALGAVIIEKHFTLDKDMPGPDHQASASPEEMQAYVEAIRNTEILLGDGIKQPRLSEEEMIPALRRSLVAARALKKGEILVPDMIQFKRPGSGISPAEFESVMGRVLIADVAMDDLIRREDLQ